MTNNDFTTAARAEADRRMREADFVTSGDMARAHGFALGAVWARDHLAAQEPTEAEVEAAARALVARVHATAWDHISEETRDVNRGDARAALTAAKEARP